MLAGYDPKLAVVATFAVAFVLITLANLTVGLALFATLSFVDTILPTGGIISVPKLMGLLLLLSWFALITAGDVERRQRIFSHQAFLLVLIAFVGWSAMSAVWAEIPAESLDKALRYLPNAFLFLDRLLRRQDA